MFVKVVWRNKKCIIRKKYYRMLCLCFYFFKKWGIIIEGFIGNCWEIIKCKVNRRMNCEVIRGSEIEV